MNEISNTIKTFSCYVFLPLLVFVFFCKTVGVLFDRSLLFTAKILFCDIIPGLVLIQWLRPDIRSPLVTVLYAPAVGMILEISVYLLFSVLQLQNYFLFYYALPFVMIFFWRKRFFEIPWENKQNLLPFLGYTALVFIVLVACTIPYIQSGLMPGIDDDLLVQLIIVKSLQQGYPFENLMSEGRPLFYNFAYHAFADASHRLAGTSTFLTTLRLAPVFCFLSLFFTVLAFCLNNLKKYPYVLASLLIVQLFAVVGFQSELVGKTFGGAISAPMARMHSNILGFTFTLILSDFIFYYLKSKLNIERKGLYLGTIFLMAFMTAGTRSAAMVFIAGGLSFLFFVALFSKHKDLAKNTLIVGLLTGVSFMGALLFFYGAYASESALNFQTVQGISGQINYIMKAVPFGYSLSPLSQYISEYLTGLIIIFVLILFRAGFLSFAYLVSVYSIVAKKFDTGLENLYYLGGLGLSLCVWIISTAPGGSQFPYLHYAGLGASLLAVTYLSFQNFRSKLSRTVFAVTALLFSVHVVELVYELFAYQFLILRRYQKQVINYKDLVGPGFERLLTYLKRNAKDGVIAFSWHAPRNIQPLLTHIVIAETGIPVLNDSKYMHPDGIIPSHSPLYTAYLKRLNASQHFLQFPDKAIIDLSSSIQNKKRILYLITDQILQSSPLVKVEYIMDDYFQQNRYFLYKVQWINPFGVGLFKKE